MSLAYLTMQAIAHTAAAIISVRRDIQTCPLTSEECEAAGLPEGSTERLILVHAVGRTRWWHFDAWTDEGDDEAGRCLNLRAFGMRAEIFHVPRGYVTSDCLPVL